MANCMIGFPNLIDDAVLSGGSFAAALPLANLQTRKLKQYARTTGVALANTKFDIDLQARRNTRVIALVGHNFSLAAKYRILGSNDAAHASPLVDTGWVDVWPVIYPFGARAWEDANWWGGKYLPDEIKDYTATLTCLLPSSTLAQYWRVEIDDTTNVTGYLQTGRLFIGPVWQPAINASWGASLAWETDTQVQKAQGGAESFDEKAPFRVGRYKLDHMTRDEAMANMFEIQRRAGVSREVFWVEDPDDTVHSLRTRFLARLRTLGPIEYPYYQHNSTAFEIKELQ